MLPRFGRIVLAAPTELAEMPPNEAEGSPAKRPAHVMSLRPHSGSRIGTRLPQDSSRASQKNLSPLIHPQKPGGKFPSRLDSQDGAARPPDSKARHVPHQDCRAKHSIAGNKRRRPV